MIGIFIITHGTLGESLIQCVCHVINKRPSHVTQLGISEQDDPREVIVEARRLLAGLDSGDGVLVLTDIFGATPANIAMKLLKPGQVEGVAGINVPMLLRVLTYREKCDIHTLVTKAISGGCDGVLHIKGGI